jgi:uncharacterized membrane protein
MNDFILVLLRTIHIFAGVLWVGSAIFYLFFVEPVVQSLGPVGPKFIQSLIEKRHYPIYMSLVSLFTILAGAVLYWNTSGGLQLIWIKTGPGIGFTIGAVVSIVVFVMGIVMLKPLGERMGELGKEIAESGGPPNDSQAAEMQILNRRLAKLERVDFILLVIALFTMATARYWGF